MIFDPFKSRNWCRSFASCHGTEGYMAFGELLEHPDLKYFTPDLSVMIDFFVEKGIVQVEPIETKGQKSIIEDIL